MLLNSLLALGNNATLQALQRALHPAKVILFDPLSIIPIDFELSSIPSVNKAIVISVSAANFGFKKLASHLASHTQIFAIGKSSAEAVQRFWPHPVRYPTSFNSESLLALPELHAIENEKILILKGKNGRDYLEKILGERKAILYTIDCYQRCPRDIDLADSVRIWQNNGVNWLLVTSAESLNAFCQQVPKTDQAWLKNLTLVVTSDRLLKAAAARGFTKIKRAKHFAIEDILKELSDDKN